MTKYRKPTNNEEGRWAIYLGGDEAIGVGCIKADIELSKLQAKYPGDLARAYEELCSIGHHTVPVFEGSLQEYLNMSIEEALSSKDVLHRCLALIDRRLGKRRLTNIKTGSHPAERKFLELRYQSENMKLDIGE